VNGTNYHQNQTNQFDVNASGDVSPLDALLIINYINSGQNSAPLITNVAQQTFPGFGYPYELVYSVTTPSSGQGKYYDASGNNLVESEDASLVIAYLNQ
jgi:hypothetical protein